MTTGSPQQEARETVNSAKSEATEARRAAKDSVTGAREQVARAARDAQEKIHEKADERLGAFTGSMADHSEQTADAAHDAAADFDEGSLQHEALERVSGFLEDTARSLRSADLESTAQEVTTFARRHPVAFLAGAATLGFAASRLLGARVPNPERMDPAESQAESWTRGTDDLGAVRRSGVAPGEAPS